MGEEQLGEIVSLENAASRRTEWRRDGKSVVVASGAFELLHPGHVRLLEQARSLGDVIVVGVENDSAVRADAELERAKNPRRSNVSRPVAPLSERAEILAALAAVDFVVELRNISAEDWIDRFQPDIYVQGGAGSFAERDDSELSGEADAAGPRTVNIALEPGYSTIALLERIQQITQ
jgi:rfaE bifunctional protein nucleotidyltransferase chain/domain